VTRWTGRAGGEHGSGRREAEVGLAQAECSPIRKRCGEELEQEPVGTGVVGGSRHDASRNSFADLAVAKAAPSVWASTRRSGLCAATRVSAGQTDHKPRGEHTLVEGRDFTRRQARPLYVFRGWDDSDERARPGSDDSPLPLHRP